jgi:hypothetical protein
MQPIVTILTPEQRKWLTWISPPNQFLLLARFRAALHSRPTIHLHDDSLLRAHSRYAVTAAYIDRLVSRYIPNARRDLASLGGRELYCIFDVGDGASELPMIVGFCSRGRRATLIPDAHFWMRRGYSQEREEFQRKWLPWQDRERRVFWRGSSTGGGFNNLTVESFLGLPRYRLCAAGARLHGLLDAKLTNIVHAKGASEAEQILDFLNSQGLFAPRVPQIEFMKYRFQIDIDGISNAWGLLLKLLMGSCVLKVASEWRQWYYDKLRPWVHYVPVKNDLSDLAEQVSWCLEHDSDAEEIGSRGRELASGIVLETELPRAAEAVLQASFGSIDELPAGCFGIEMFPSAPGRASTKMTAADTQISEDAAQEIVYLMTAHGTFLGLDNNANLIQLYCTAANLPRLIRLPKIADDRLIAAAALADYEMGVEKEVCAAGVFFKKNDKYLCALPNSVRLVVDREARGIWETFIPIEPDLLPVVMERLGYLVGTDRRPETEMERFRRVITKLISQGRLIKLYCGAGLVPRPGFINLDRVMMAPRFALSNPEQYFIFPFVDQAWPVPDNCVDYIFHEEFIEHISQLKQIGFLAETRRVLKPGGWHRVNTPNRITTMKRLSDFDKGFAGVYTGEAKWGQISVLTPSALKEIARLVGYSEVVFTARHQGRSPFTEWDLRPRRERDGADAHIFADLLK